MNLLPKSPVNILGNAIKHKNEEHLAQAGHTTCPKTLEDNIHFHKMNHLSAPEGHSLMIMLNTPKLPKMPPHQHSTITSPLYDNG